jgi:hypothetical protein
LSLISIVALSILIEISFISKRQIPRVRWKLRAP